MKINVLTNNYNIKKLSDIDCDDILKLYNSNPEYFEYCPPSPTIDSIKEELIITPNNIGKENKYFLGFYDNADLIGVLDLITNYPDDRTCFIGLFMIDAKYQNKGIGTDIINEISNNLKNNGYEFIKLAYIFNNDKARNFWLKNKFVQIKQTKDLSDQLDVVLCRRQL